MNQDIEINAGEDFEMSVDIYEDDGVTEKNISGATFDGQVRDVPYGTLLGSFTFAIVTAATGKAKATMASSVTAGLLAASPSVASVYDVVRRSYDIFMTLGGVRQRLVGGAAKITPEVSQS